MPVVSYLYNHMIPFRDAKIGKPFGLLLVETIPTCVIIWVAQSKISLGQRLALLIIFSHSTDATLCTLQVFEETLVGDLHVFHCGGRGHAYDCHQGRFRFSG